MRKSRTTTIAIVGALALSSVGLASCGSDKVSPSEYVGTICTSLGDFQSTILEGQTTLQQAAAGDLSPDDGKTQLSSFFDEAASASETAASEVEDAGVPDVDNGEEIADAINGALDKVTSTFQDAQDQVDGLPTDSDQAFGDAAQELSTSFQDDLTAIGEGLSQVDESPDLESAAEDNPDCTAIQNAPTTGTTGATGP